MEWLIAAGVGICIIRAAVATGRRLKENQKHYPPTEGDR